MVKVEIVEEKDPQSSGNSPYASSSSSRHSSQESISSVSSELSAEENLYDRISALVDIVPPTTRHNISTKFSSAASFVRISGKVIGNIVWIVTTSALLVGLPLALSLEDEAKIVAQEREMIAQQQGAQQVSVIIFFCHLDMACLLILNAYRCFRQDQLTHRHRAQIRHLKRASFRPASDQKPACFQAVLSPCQQLQVLRYFMHTCTLYIILSRSAVSASPAAETTSCVAANCHPRVIRSCYNKTLLSSLSSPRPYVLVWVGWHLSDFLAYAENRFTGSLELTHPSNAFMKSFIAPVWNNKQRP